MFFSSIKRINRLISKGMSNIYLKVTVEKNWRSPGQFLGSYNSRRYHWILLNLIFSFFFNWVQICVWLFYYFNFERNYGALKSKSPYFLLNKNANFNKNEMESKMGKIPHKVLERQALCFIPLSGNKKVTHT